MTTLGAPAHKALAGSSILVTGSTSGIGRATAALLTDQGANVLVVGRHQAEVDATVMEMAGDGKGEPWGLAADVAHRDDINRIFHAVDEKWGRIDVLVNNAALGAGDVAGSSYEEIEYVVRTNLIGYMACANAAAARMQHGGTIVNVGSMSASVREEGGSVYVATKSGVQGFSEALRKELNPLGIRICLVEPGAVGTDMQPISPSEQDEKEAAGEMLHVDDVASVVLFCLTQDPRADIVEVRIRPRLQLI